MDLTPEQQKRIADLFAQLDGMNLYDLLGATRLADKKELKRAYNERAMELHPDRFFRKRLGTFKPKLEAIFARMTEAQRILCSPDSRAQYDAALQAQRTSLIDVMLEQAAAEMAGSATSARYEEFEQDELEVIEVRSTPPPAPAPASARTPLPTERTPLPSERPPLPSERPPQPSVRAPLSPADLEARRRMLARKLTPHGMPAVRPPPGPPKKSG